MLIAIGSVAAQAQDLPGTTDHPAISRYAGSVIIAHDFRKFDEFVLPLGGVNMDTGTPTARKSQTLEGRVTRLVYIAPPERSTLEVLRNYEQELKKGGFQTLFACALKTCSPSGDGMARLVYPMARSQTLKGQDPSIVLTMAQEERYLAARRTSAEGDTYLSLYIAKDTNPGCSTSCDTSQTME